jgi:hypothetical protein
MIQYILIAFLGILNLMLTLIIVDYRTTIKNYKENADTLQFIISQFLSHSKDVSQQSIYAYDETILTYFKHANKLAQQLELIQNDLDNDDETIYKILEEFERESIEQENGEILENTNNATEETPQKEN